MKIGEIIKNRRTELGLTLEEVGNAVGVGKSTVRKWETGMINNMGRDKIAALSRILNIDPVFFVCDEPVLSEFLSKDEKDLLEDYRNLNKEGQAQVRQYANEKAQLPQYKKCNSVEDVG